MTTAEAGKYLLYLFELVVGLAILALGLTIARRFLEQKVKRSMKRHQGSLVGKRAMVISDLRAGQVGMIRPLGSSEEEKNRASKQEDTREQMELFPAMADELISRGRVVRVTGGDADGYLVRPL